ncbi:unnamed protein product [[Candida] boidinii]|uniref:Unnamed protein product n=1 Tax=Candida boidinii TaxID=5477 RepID=A0A9W6WIR0_CANBO|nr:unnamed protein product [[Candida] boidinii]GME88653.1 unnamed protein product [[Candida] boidinii]GMF50649.1 unnamed protein product [[Candida] boidinii]GMF98942.1 unnamed protein product [[Candida] boidinii]
MLLEYSTCILGSVMKWIKGLSRLWETCRFPAVQSPSTSRDVRNKIVNPEPTSTTLIPANRTTTDVPLLESM